MTPAPVTAARRTPNEQWLRGGRVVLPGKGHRGAVEVLTLKIPTRSSWEEKQEGSGQRWSGFESVFLRIGFVCLEFWITAAIWSFCLCTEVNHAPPPPPPKSHVHVESQNVNESESRAFADVICSDGVILEWAGPQSRDWCPCKKVRACTRGR